jgi:chromosomal replication initiator protein
MDPAQLWQTALADLQIQMRPEDFRTWFRDTSVISYDGSRCVVGVENPFNVDWLSTKCAGLVSRTLQSLVGNPVDVQFVVERPEPSVTAPPPLTLSAPPRGTRSRAAARRAPSEPRVAISPRYTFDSFVVGKNNQFAHAACMNAAQRPGQVHNPLFIYGGVGLGKTHLLHAIAHAGLARGLEVVYVSSETFTNEFIESISRGRMEEFRAKYRRTDILLIDDIQFIAGKDGTQEEFFHTFNAVHQASGQIVMTSDRHPKAITTLEERLRSRFVWGLMTDIQLPDLETRTAILRSKVAEAAQHGGSQFVPNEVLDFIAAKVPSNIRELEGALNRVLAYAAMMRAAVTIELAAAALHEVVSGSHKGVVAPEAVIQAVCRGTGVSRGELEGKQRDRRVVVPRQIAMHLLREETDLSLSEIGALFGGRDHSTVMHSCEKVAADVEHNERVRDMVRTARELLAVGKH